MQHSVDEIVYRLLRKKSLADVSVKQLEDLVHDFPYFSLTRYLLAKKAVITNLPERENYIRDLTLFVPNAEWMEYVLNEGLTVDEDSLKNNNDTSYDDNEVSPNALVAKEVVEIVKEEEEETITTVPAEPEENASLAETLRQIKVEATTISETDEIPLDPYHRIDYFASQGIKLKNDDLNKDQMGRQLKKFTEWLKTMKRIPENESIADIDDATSRNIQNLAARSIAGTEIITEAMAEVLIKQKHYSQAIELYKKLSLQIPAKSTYFASRIEELNKQVS